MPTLYVTSLEPGEGKTALALSLAALAADRGRKAGYFKPVTLAEGEGWTPDLDTAFYRQVLGRDDPAPLAPRAESPEALTSGLGADLRGAIAQRWAKVSAGKDVVFVEGLPSSGATAAAARDLAELVDARVVAVVRFRRGLDLSRVAALRELFGARLAGVVLNAVPAHGERIAREDAVPALEAHGIQVLGIVPEDRLLLGFTVAEYSQRPGGRILNDEERAGELVESILLGAMVVDSSEHYYERRERKALVTRADRPDLQWNALEGSTRCLILTGGKEPIAYVRERAADAGVPLVLVEPSTVETVAAIEAFVTAPAFHHREKLARYKELLRAGADLAALGL